jgi:metal-responsive CopG/Arc/MetJ family transcriptional regulator
MKVQTSVMLPENLLSTISQLSEKGKTLSDFIETALQLYIAKLNHSDNSYKDIEIINRNADALNQEAEDDLQYQVEL